MVFPMTTYLAREKLLTYRLLLETYQLSEFLLAIDVKPSITFVIVTFIPSSLIDLTLTRKVLSSINSLKRLSVALLSCV